MQALVAGLALFLSQAPPALAAEGDALHGAANGVAEHAVVVADLAALDHRSKQGVKVFAGMVEAFLHRGPLNHAEVDCMLLSVENITHLAYKASADLTSALEALLGPSGTLAEATAAAVDMVLVIPQLEERLDGLVELLGRYLGPCLGDAAQKALQEAGRHLNNLTYVAGHIQANGADIVREIADAYQEFGAGKCEDFGRSVGRACRKVLLSKASVPRLPEGAPSVPQLVNMSAGILQGFFRKGVELDITSEARATKSSIDEARAPRSFIVETDATESGPLNLRIDLHECVKANLGSFRSAVLGLLQYFSQQELATESEPMEGLPSILTSTMVEAPVALSKCGLGEEQLEMLMSALEALDSVHVELRLPKSGAHFDADGPVGQLQKAAEDWKTLDWFALGKDLGGMLLQLVVQVFPQKYAMDDAGALSKRLTGLAAALAQGSRTLIGSVLLLLAAALPLLGVATVTRSRRGMAKSGASPHGLSGDFEGVLDRAAE
eukprot:CAMPEP_0179037720 /NCGR_PEP_ID=MMETSP0796-20121207/14271_1 /TAXON_ID=73915 /ORGANISM="Pyrodinium bahamense, Strain pbaha01" /LENGTH=494 /DNA_ID=CAMNT_0020734031 /DNA_START=77 /DNA_END=1561 /DNA_ORIENTATION=-